MPGSSLYIHSIPLLKSLQLHHCKKMIHAIRSSVRTNPTPSLFSSSLPSHFGRKTSTVRFFQATADHKEPDNMDKDNKPDQETGAEKDVMSHPFGEGYATRSDEEGLGGTFGSNQYPPPKKHDDIHEDHPEYDKSQGSEVKEKEKSRHQTSAPA